MDHPTLSWDASFANELAPRLGGGQHAERFIAIAEEVDANQTFPVARLAELQGETLRIMALLEGEPARRWLTLGEQISRRRYMGR